MHIVANAAFAGSPDGLWDDDHMAYFYTNLPSLTTVVPSMALNNGKDAEPEDAPSGEEIKNDAQGTAGSDEAQVPASDGGDAEDQDSLSGGARSHVVVFSSLRSARAPSRRRSFCALVPACLPPCFGTACSYLSALRRVLRKDCGSYVV